MITDIDDFNDSLAISTDIDRVILSSIVDGGTTMVVEPSPMANDRSKICEVMSEHNNQAQIGEVLSTTAALVGSGQVTGVSVVVGSDLIECNPIFEGYSLQVISP